MPLLNDKSLLEPESSCTIKDHPMPSPMPPPNTPDSSQGLEKAPSTPKHDQGNLYLSFDFLIEKLNFLIEYIMI